MKLARIVKRDDPDWRLSGDTQLNPPVGTIVQYDPDAGMYFYTVYFPGCTAGCVMMRSVFNKYFEDLTDANS